APLVIAWGGDGTVNEAAQALAHSVTALGLVPAGSGNGFAVELGIPRQPARALRGAVSWPPRRIDAGRLDGRFFVNIAGAGFDGLVARRFQAHGRRGALPYLTIGLAAGLGYRPRRYRVELDGTVLEGRALLVACANGRQYGNGAAIAPRACFADGLLDVVFVDSRPFVVDLLRLPFLFLRAADRVFGVRTRRARRVSIEADEPVDLHVDGEPVEPARRAAVEVLPGALRVAAPPLRTSAGTARGSARRS
ncbi:MAG TPA: diacylglycerol kinase family protein, partial [Vicinamibacterales bacterium]|nr:diacylglycerol kinase family protein [Vicinamibacterales bacterium]